MISGGAREHRIPVGSLRRSWLLFVDLGGTQRKRQPTMTHQNRSHTNHHRYIACRSLLTARVQASEPTHMSVEANEVQFGMAYPSTIKENKRRIRRTLP